MEVPFLDLQAQYRTIKREIDDAIMSSLSSASFIGGDKHEQFSYNFSQFIGSKNTVLVGNGTDALTIALKSLNLPTGSEVIVPANSFIATSEAVTAAGLKVVFCDISDETFNINPEMVSPLITSHTKAIIAVHLYGQPCDIAQIKKKCDENNLYLIEDCAQAHGALYQNKTIGTFGDVAAFSFYPGKNLGAYGDGGAIVTDNDDIALFCKKYANHGRTKKYNHDFEGVNSRLDTIQCAILDVKLKYLPEWNSKRRIIADKYNTVFRQLSWMSTQKEICNSKGVYHLFAVRVKDRHSFLKYLDRYGIHYGIHYPIGLPFLKAYKHLKATPDSYPITFQHQQEVVSLPIYPEMTDEMISYIINVICQYKTN